MVPQEAYYTLNILWDANPDETTWEITDGAGGIVATGGPYNSSPVGVLAHLEIGPLPAGAGPFTFTMYDSGSNGQNSCNFALNGVQMQGYFEIVDNTTGVVVGSDQGCWDGCIVNSQTGNCLCSNSSISLPLGSPPDILISSTFTGTGITNTGSGTASFSPALAGPGDHDIEYIVDYDGLCEYNYMQTVTVNISPFLDFQNDIFNCGGFDLNTINITGSGLGAIDFSDSNGLITGAGLQLTAPYSDMVTVSSSNGGCTDMISFQVDLVETPSIDLPISAVDECATGFDLSTISLTGTNIASANFVYYEDNAGIPGATTSPVVAMSDNYWIEPIIGTAPNICTGAAAEVSITLTPETTPALDGPLELCEYDMPIVLDNYILDAGVTGSWAGSGVNANEFDPSTLDGLYTIDFDPDGQCELDNTIDITVYTMPPAPSTDIPSQICSEDPLPDINLTSTVNGTIDWYDDDPSVNIAANLIGSGAILSGYSLSDFNKIATNTYEFYIVETANNCVGAVATYSFDIVDCQCPITSNYQLFNDFCGSADFAELNLPNLSEMIMEMINQGTADPVPFPDKFIDIDGDSEPDLYWELTEGGSTSSYAPDPTDLFLTSLNIDGCDPKAYTIEAYVLCDLDNDMTADDPTDKKTVFLLDFSIYPDLSGLNFDINNASGDCGPYINGFDCEAEGYEIQYDFGSGFTPLAGGAPFYPSAPSTSGDIIFQVVNPSVDASLGVVCQSIQSGPYPYQCPECPVETTTGFPVVPSNIVCGDYTIPTSETIDDVLNIISTEDLDPFGTALDADGDGQVDIYWRYGTPGSTFTVFTPANAPTLSASGCDPVLYLFDAYIYCDADGDGNADDANGNGVIDNPPVVEDVDDRFYVKFYDVVIFPPISPTINQDACSATLDVSLCASYDVAYEAFDDLGASLESGNGNTYAFDPGFSGSIDFTVTDTGNYTFTEYGALTIIRPFDPGCNFEDSVDLNCPLAACPTLQDPSTTSSQEELCMNGMAVLPGLTIVDETGTIVSNEVQWFTEVSDPQNPTGQYANESIDYAGDGCNVFEYNIYAYVLCDVDGLPSTADEAVALGYIHTMYIYPDLSATDIEILNDNACGPYVNSWDCMGIAGFEIDNDSGFGNGAVPDFTSVQSSGNITFTFTNTNAPSVAACTTTIQSANYNCTACPSDIIPADGLQYFLWRFGTT